MYNGITTKTRCKFPKLPLAVPDIYDDLYNDYRRDEICLRAGLDLCFAPSIQI